ncbi:restriction endonuclease subunit S [Sorangium sp. So ce448]|uniref:restriction endonuclease subunit S n=1 Tax=Sorangium sp. So ce448 TaxID=3133314 RepID=UPI003F6182E7
MSEDRALPSGWVLAPLGVITQIQGGIQKQPSRVPKNHAFPFLRVANVLRGRLDLSDIHRIEVFPGELERFRLAVGDLLVVEGNGSKSEIGRTAIWAGAIECCVHQNHIIRVRPPAGLRSRFLASYLNSPDGISQLIDRASSTSGLHTLSVSKLASIAVPVAPIAEQGRIVAAIEQHLSGIDAGVASLERVLANLKRYRAAVLKAACEGRLVPTEAELATKEGREYEPGDVLLRRILDERRARWEADQLAKMKAKGQVPRDDKWKAKYEEPKGPETNILPEIPNGWVWCTVDSLLAGIEAGSSFKCDERPPQSGDIGVAKVSAVTWGTYDECETKTCTDPDRVDPGLFVAPGDFLFSRANTIELVGACVIAERVTKKIMLSDKILRLRIVDAEPRWLLYSLRSQHGRREIERLATGNQESMRNIGQDRIRQIRIPLPPHQEQQRIIAEIERLLSVADETEQTVRAQLARAQRLRQSVLKRAFEGKLVPQDPNDEPASTLLDRIRAVRAAAPATNGFGRTSRRGRAKVVQADEGGLDDG